MSYKKSEIHMLTLSNNKFSSKVHLKKYIYNNHSVLIINKNSSTFSNADSRSLQIAKHNETEKTNRKESRKPKLPTSGTLLW